MTIAEIALRLGRRKQPIKLWIKPGKYESALVDRKDDIDVDQISELRTELQTIDVYQPHKTSMLVSSLATLSASGAVTVGVLTSFVFSSWVVALAAILGGMWGVFVAAFGWIAGVEARDED